MSAPHGAWLQPLPQWLAATIDALRAEPSVVRILLAEVRGSTPRAAGDSMLLARQQRAGTVGGGQLEYAALQAAQAMLDERGPAAQLRRIVLGVDAGQCCGGVVTLWLERFARTDLQWLERAQVAMRAGGSLLRTRYVAGSLEHQLLTGADIASAPGLRFACGADGSVEFTERLDSSLPPLWLYGAGHVGQALARLLFELPFALTWIDPRPEIFPAGVPAGVRTLTPDSLAASVATAPGGTRFLVMTHSHALDYELCHAILSRQDFWWAGLIGSRSKAARFRSRLARNGIPAEAIARLSCPVGIGGIDSKWPAAIAVAIAAELLRDAGVTGAELRLAQPAGEPCVAIDCNGCVVR